MAVGSLLMPALLSGVYFVHIRLPLFSYLLIVASCRPQLQPRRTVTLAAAVFAALLALRTTTVADRLAAADREIAELRTAAATIEEGARVLPVNDVSAEAATCPRAITGTRGLSDDRPVGLLSAAVQLFQHRRRSRVQARRRRRRPRQCHSKSSILRSALATEKERLPIRTTDILAQLAQRLRLRRSCSISGSRLTSVPRRALLRPARRIFAIYRVVR